MASFWEKFKKYGLPILGGPIYGAIATAPRPVKARVKRYFRPTPQVRARDVIREIPGAAYRGGRSIVRDILEGKRTTPYQIIEAQKKVAELTKTPEFKKLPLVQQQMAMARTGAKETAKIDPILAMGITGGIRKPVQKAAAQQIKKAITKVAPIAEEAAEKAAGVKLAPERFKLTVKMPKTKKGVPVTKTTQIKVQTRGKGTKERGFVTSIKKSPYVAPRVKSLTEGDYVPRPHDPLYKKAQALIKKDIGAATDAALSRYDDFGTASAIGLIDHYQSIGDFGSAAQIANKLAPKLTQMGQANAASALLNRIHPTGVTRWAASELNKVGLSLQPTDAKRLFTMAEEIQGMQEGMDKMMKAHKLTEEVEKLVPTPAIRKIMSTWRAGLLTGIRTHMGNITSNITHGGLEIVKDVPATMTDIVMSWFTKKRTTTTTVKGYGRGMWEGANKGYNYVKTGFDERNFGRKYEYFKVNFGKSRIARGAQAYTDWTFRMMGAEDQPFYYGAFRRSIEEIAKVSAINKKLTGKAAKEFIKKTVMNPPDDILVKATQDAQISVFLNPTMLGKWGTGIKTMSRGNPAGEFASEFIFPFVRTPSAVGMQLVNYSPIGFAKTVIESVNKGKFDQRTFAKGIGRAVTGTGILAIGANLLKNNLMTLDYPTKETEKALWEQEGKTPYSVKVGGKWRSLNYTSPLGQLAIVGGYYQKKLDETGSSSQAIQTALLGTPKAVMEQTFLFGVQNLLKATEDPEMFGPSYMRLSAASLVPRIIAQLAQAIDPYKREAGTVPEAMMRNIPGATLGLHPRRGAFGEPMKREPGIWGAVGTMVDPFRSVTARTTPLVTELRRLFEADEAVAPTRLKRKQKIIGEDIEITPEQLDKLEQIVGPNIKSAWQGVVASSEYQGLDDTEKRRTLDKIKDDIRAASRTTLVAEEGILSEDKQIKAIKKLSKDEYDIFSRLITGENITGRVLTKARLGQDLIEHQSRYDVNLIKTKLTKNPAAYTEAVYTYTQALEKSMTEDLGIDDTLEVLRKEKTLLGSLVNSSSMRDTRTENNLTAYVANAKRLVTTIAEKMKDPYLNEDDKNKLLIEQMEIVASIQRYTKNVAKAGRGKRGKLPKQPSLKWPTAPRMALGVSVPAIPALKVRVPKAPAVGKKGVARIAAKRYIPRETKIKIKTAP